MVDKGREVVGGGGERANSGFGILPSSSQSPVSKKGE